MSHIPIDKEHECVVEVTRRLSLVCPAHPEPCSYLRLVVDGETELVMWSWEEWRDDPQTVIGAVMGMMNDHQMREG